MSKMHDISKAARVRTALGTMANNAMSTAGNDADVAAIASLYKILNGNTTLSAALYTALESEMPKAKTPEPVA